MKNKRDLLRVGIIGTGVGIRTHLPAFRRVQNVEVFAISGSSENRAKSYASKYNIPNPMQDYKSLLDLPELDLVCVASPNLNHFEHVSYAVKRSVNILCEKPLAVNMDETVQLLDLTKTYDKLALVNHQLRFNPYIKKVKEILNSNIIGQPYYVKIHQQSTGFANRSAEWSWSFEAQSGGGVRLAMGSHLIDLITYWFGGEFLNVRGAMDLVIPERQINNGKSKKVTACSFFSSSIAMGDNLDVQLSATAASCGIPRFDFSIYGTHGEVHFDLESKLRAAYLDDLGNIKQVHVENVTNDELENNVSIFKGSSIYFAKSIIEAISKKNNNFVEDAARFTDAYNTQIVLEAIQNSALSGKVVNIKEGYHPGEMY